MNNIPRVVNNLDLWSPALHWLHNCVLGDAEEEQHGDQGRGGGWRRSDVSTHVTKLSDCLKTVVSKLPGDFGSSWRIFLFIWSFVYELFITTSSRIWLNTLLVLLSVRKSASLHYSFTPYLSKYFIHIDLYKA